jgi:hypothetical protein
VDSKIHADRCESPPNVDCKLAYIADLQAIPGLSYRFSLRDDYSPPVVVFNQPLNFELIGAGFQKLPGSRYHALRWPRVQKLYSDRSWTEALSGPDYLVACLEALGHVQKDHQGIQSSSDFAQHEDTLTRIFQATSTHGLDMVDLSPVRPSVRQLSMKDEPPSPCKLLRPTKSMPVASPTTKPSDRLIFGREPLPSRVNRCLSLDQVLQDTNPLPTAISIDRRLKRSRTSLGTAGRLLQISKRRRRQSDPCLSGQIRGEPLAISAEAREPAVKNNLSSFSSHTVFLLCIDENRSAVAERALSNFAIHSSFDIFINHWRYSAQPGQQFIILADGSAQQHIRQLKQHIDSLHKLHRAHQPVSILDHHLLYAKNLRPEDIWRRYRL